jgi:hypothetical protein
MTAIPTTTTIRVSRTTRDRLMRTRNEDFHGVPIDEVIIRLLNEHEEQALRVRMRADAEHARSNADDLAEVRRVQAEMDDVSAW